MKPLVGDVFWRCTSISRRNRPHGSLTKMYASIGSCPLFTWRSVLAEWCAKRRHTFKKIFVAVSLPSAVYTVAARGLYEPPETLVGLVIADNSSSNRRGVEAADPNAGVRRRMTLGDGVNRFTVVGISKFKGRLCVFVYLRFTGLSPVFGWGGVCYTGISVYFGVLALWVSEISSSRVWNVIKARFG